MVSLGHRQLGGVWMGHIVKKFFKVIKPTKKISPLFIITSNGQFLTTSVIKTLLPQICCLSKFQEIIMVAADFSYVKALNERIFVT